MECVGGVCVLVGWFAVEVFTPGQHPTSFQHGYRIVTVCTHGDVYSAAPLGNQVTSSMGHYPTQSHYPVTEPTSPYPVLLIVSAWLERVKCKFYKSFV